MYRNLVTEMSPDRNGSYQNGSDQNGQTESAKPVAYAENFHGGDFIQWRMVSFVFGVRCL